MLLHDGPALQAVVLSARDFKSIASLEVLQQRLGDFVHREFPGQAAGQTA